MNHEPKKAGATHSSGLSNDFSEQEATMTNSAMPPAFALKAGPADGSPGAKRPAPVQTRLKLQGVPPELVAELEKFEGIRWKVYADHLGNLTGGMGHLIKAEEKAAFPNGSTISEAQVQSWAQSDVSLAWNRAKELSAELGVQDHDFNLAMASMCFQNGIYWNTVHKKTWALMKEHQWEAAAIECADSKWARETPARVPGFQAALRARAGAKLGDGAKQPVSEEKPSQNAEKHSLSPAAKAEKLKAAFAEKNAKPATQQVPSGPEGIKQIQAKLQALGLYSGKIDGIAKSSKGESRTTSGIKQFQKSKGLAVTGEVDAATWAQLQRAGKPSPQAETPAIWDSFMANLEKQQAPGKEAMNAGTTATGNFVDDKYWRSQLSSGEVRAVNVGDTKCRLVATEMLLLYLKGERPEMLEKLGLADTGSLKQDVSSMAIVPSETEANFLSILEEDKSHKDETDQKKNYNPDHWYFEGDQTSKAIAYIESYLSQKIPTLVGVDHTYNRDLSAKISSKYGNGYNEGTTDHFITLTGIGIDENGGKYYSFVDPGRATKAAGAGTNKQNRLYHRGGGTFQGSHTGSHNAQTYHLSMVVLFPCDRAKFAAEREENRKKWIK